MKRYKLITNYNTMEEKTRKANNVTNKMLGDMLTSEYIILTYNDFLGYYIPLQDNLTKENKLHFDINKKELCEVRY